MSPEDVSPKGRVVLLRVHRRRLHVIGWIGGTAVVAWAFAWGSLWFVTFEHLLIGSIARTALWQRLAG
ncbi:MAG TPA: hypothetical protein VMG11_07980 [Steroidobacteraceae bacterium]|nr:hypothetical protein [Steroidobacteraceae bacterium]